jgi:lipopolysaccharide heptosyltransferase I
LVCVHCNERAAGFIPAVGSLAEIEIVAAQLENDAKSPRILIVRLSAIGDVIHGMPLACALRERFPQALITWVVEERAAEVLRGHQALDDLIVLPRGWLKSPPTVWRLRRRLRAARFDVALEAQGLIKAAIAAWLSGARRRIGFGGRWGRELSPWLNTELVDASDRHAIQRYLALLEPLGIYSPAVRFQVPECGTDARIAAAVLEELGLGDRFAIVNVGAGWPSKLWPAARWAAVAAHLGRAWTLPSLVVWGNAEERQRAEEVVLGSAGHARLAPKMTLGQLAALARRASLFLGSDTGPLHLAAAVGTPCVGLYGPWPAEKHGPYGPQHVVLQKMRLEGSTRQRRHAPPVYMEAIDVADVCDACRQILTRPPVFAARDDVAV